MKIPAAFQVFDKRISIQNSDVKALKPHLSGWNHLHEMMLLGAFEERDLMKMVIVELMGEKRKLMIDRILMRLGKVQRRKIEARIKKCLNAN